MAYDRSWLSFTAWCTARRKVSLATSFFEKLAKTMASGMLRPGTFRIFRTACSTFFWCAALFFDMLGSWRLKEYQKGVLGVF